ncbi:hypothetical protein W97_04511 [Coniosporium apollinis CBS 100218]|uniref:T6SS Phospholipase effector Tle1-like catalytic domain-containing protein n=1 Tax=Coniosporium apollinis (strain CBS 100218) TaxID=1168221 RepID=R7YTU7_CONA1|nr:uncharacterized protein W97_04511 [Coniosporium apollinis CBS 100218]EON65273.1 hypothetical protein W97_04511 [Coniosporium apollinis CBS 100218]
MAVVIREDDPVTNTKTSTLVIRESTTREPAGGREVVLRPQEARSPARGSGSREPPFKRLIVANDGTWLNSDDGRLTGELAIPSNVTRLSRAIKPVSADGIPQVVYYHYGVASRGNVVSRVVMGSTGEGLEENVRDGYSFLANNYSTGDEIFLTGFSRGAFTSRSIAGMMAVVGLLTKAGLNFLPEIHRDVLNRRNPDYRPRNRNAPFPNKPSASDPRYREELYRRGLTRLDVSVKAIGVWDTVGALGAPRVGLLTRVGLQDQESDEMQFYDTKLSNIIENAFQALALDERRTAFRPAVWEKPQGNRTILRQVWFPGVHSNIGGGHDDQELSNITLAWMMSQLEPFLDMRLSYLLDEADKTAQYYRQHAREPVRPWSFGKIENSNTGIYAIGGGTTRTPGTYYAVDPDGRETSRPLRDTHEYIHSSVRTRLRLGGPGIDDKGRYDPEALDDWKLVVEYPPDSGGGGGGRGSEQPNIYWRARFREQNVSTRVLPESPLWRLERELAQRDPETYEYVLYPPETRPERGAPPPPPPQARDPRYQDEGPRPRDQRYIDDRPPGPRDAPRYADEGPPPRDQRYVDDRPPPPLVPPPPGYFDGGAPPPPPLPRDPRDFAPRDPRDEGPRPRDEPRYADEGPRAREPRYPDDRPPPPPGYFDSGPPPPLPRDPRDYPPPGDPRDEGPPPRMGRYADEEPPYPPPAPRERDPRDYAPRDPRDEGPPPRRGRYVDEEPPYPPAPREREREGRYYEGPPPSLPRDPRDYR